MYQNFIFYARRKLSSRKKSQRCDQQRKKMRRVESGKYFGNGVLSGLLLPDSRVLGIDSAKGGLIRFGEEVFSNAAGHYEYLKCRAGRWLLSCYNDIFCHVIGLTCCSGMEDDKRHCMYVCTSPPRLFFCHTLVIWGHNWL